MVESRNGDPVRVNQLEKGIVDIDKIPAEKNTRGLASDHRKEKKA